MKTAWLYLRHTTDKRYQLFSEGLRMHGFKIENGLPPNDFGPNDIFVSWNRLSAANKIAEEFKARKQKVLIAENASWGNEFAGKQWFHIAKDYHNTAGMFPVGGKDRWDDLGIQLAPFRTQGEKIILPQRGIGSKPVAMPSTWLKEMKKAHKCRVRKHPGKNKAIPLEKDLKNIQWVITWGSGAAIKALMLGVNVLSFYPNWVGKQDNTEQGRLKMFRELAWAQWTHEEIENGYAFARLLML